MYIFVDSSSIAIVSYFAYMHFWNPLHFFQSLVHYRQIRQDKKKLKFILDIMTISFIFSQSLTIF